jgi:hypothetical protein
MTNDLLIYGENICAFPHIRKPFLIYDLASDPTWISLYEENLVFFFYQCKLYLYSDKFSYPTPDSLLQSHMSRKETVPWDDLIF